MIFSTSQCSEGSHPEIRFALDDQMGVSPKWLIDYFSAQIHSGVRFEAGQTVQIGWMIAQLEDCGDGALELWEPDFDSMPIRWCKGVNNVMRHLIIQRAVCEALNCEPDFPNLRHAGMVSPRFPQCLEFSMSRDQASGNDSGWIFTDIGYAGSSGEFRSLYQIALDIVEIIPFLALPAGASVTKTPFGIEIRLDGKCVSSDDNEFLSRLDQDPPLV